MRRSFRLAVGSRLEGGVDGGVVNVLVRSDFLHPKRKLIIEGRAHRLGRFAHCLYGGASLLNRRVVLDASSGDIGPFLGPICLVNGLSNALKHGVAHLCVLSNANGWVETDAVEDFDAGFAGLDGAEMSCPELRLLRVVVFRVTHLFQTNEHAVEVGLDGPNSVNASMDRIYFAAIGATAPRATFSANDLHADVPVSAHSVTIAGTVPGAWGIGAGLRLGVEGDAGEWEWGACLSTLSPPASSFPCGWEEPGMLRLSDAIAGETEWVDVWLPRTRKTRR